MLGRVGALVAVMLAVVGCEHKLRFYAGDSAEVAVGTVDLQCTKGGVDDDGPVLGSFTSSDPEVVSVARAPLMSCVYVNALAEGEATITVDDMEVGSASILIRAVPAEQIALGRNDTQGSGSVVTPTAASYPAGSSLYTNFVWLSGGRPLRGSTADGFTLTDPTVATLHFSRGFGDWGGLDFIGLVAPGATQVYWNGLPGPVLNVVP